LAGAVSFAAEKEGLLKPYIIEVMRQEWAEGRNIGEIDTLFEVAEVIGLSHECVEAASSDESYLVKMDENWQEAQSKGVIGVPSFTVDDQIFWGNDRIDSLKDHLHDLRLRNI
jgi:2-hydroxychromene-2-carboxylate isomerase